MSSGGAASSARPLVIAVGNRFRGDDGVGGAVLDELAVDPVIAANADLVELDAEPTRLLDAWTARRSVVVVDAVRLDDHEPGELVELSGDDALDPASVARWRAGVSGHGAGLSEALRLGMVLERMPAELCIVGIAVGSLAEGPGLCPAVAAAVPLATRAVRAHLGVGPAPHAREVADVPR